MTTHNDTLQQILDKEKELDILKNQIAELYEDLEDTISQEVVEKLKKKEYNCGTVNVLLGDYQIKYVVPKKVIWDQDELALLKQSIADANQDPKMYMETKLSIKESLYNNWSEDLKNFFGKARTVEQGKPRISIERK